MIRVIACFLVVLFLSVCPDPLPAHDSSGREHRSIRQETREDYRSGKKHRERETAHGEEGNEATGQVAALLFVLANLKMGVSFLARLVNRFSGSGSSLGASMTGVSRFLNKHLRKVHYLLNPIALTVALLHLFLSSCRSTPLPEWGLLMAAAMVLLGFMVKFKLSFKWMRRSVYRIHTASLSILLLIFVLLAGHLMVD
jgi:hypothetical protein